MSLEQYKDANRKELWEILQIQVERISELENIPTYFLTRRPFRPSIDTADKKEHYNKGFEDALNEIQYKIDKSILVKTKY